MVMAPLADSAPMILAEEVPIFTVPPRILMPEKIPEPEVLVEAVVTVKFVMVFPCISEVGDAATVSSIGIRAGVVPVKVKVLVPVPSAEL